MAACLYTNKHIKPHADHVPAYYHRCTTGHPPLGVPTSILTVHVLLWCCTNPSPPPPTRELVVWRWGRRLGLIDLPCSMGKACDPNLNYTKARSLAWLEADHRQGSYRMLRARPNQ